MNVAAAFQVVAPADTLSDLAEAVDTLAGLQKEISRLEKVARVLRSKVQEGMAARGLDAFVTGRGHRAAIFSTTRTSADREVALQVLSPEVLALIFKAVTSVSLRVK